MCIRGKYDGTKQRQTISKRIFLNLDGNTVFDISSVNIYVNCVYTVHMKALYNIVNCNKSHLKRIHVYLVRLMNTLILLFFYMGSLIVMLIMCTF